MSYLPQLEHDLELLADRLAEQPDADRSLGADRHSTPGRVRVRRPLRRVLVASAALAACVVAGVLAVGIGSHGRLDVVAEARAALSPNGSILHVVITRRGALLEPSGKAVPYAGGGQAPLGHEEQWSTTDPVRWRSVTAAPVPFRRSGNANDRLGQLYGPVQTAYAGGAQSHYQEARKSMAVVTGFSDRGQAAVPLIFSTAGRGERSVTDVHGMLDRAELRDAGTATVRGHQARRLVHTERDDEGSTTRVEFFVDPRTFVPLRIVNRRTPPPPLREGHLGSLSSVFTTDFLVFERLPDTPANERLLVITPPPGTKVITQTLAEAQAHMRATSPRPVVKQASK